MIIDHTHPAYVHKWGGHLQNQYNWLFCYSAEILSNIIPLVKTDRNWITVNIPIKNHMPQFDQCCDNHSIVFVNGDPENYEWLSRFHDLILVCNEPEKCEKVAHLGHAVYLPMSVNLDYLIQFERTDRKGKAFVCDCECDGDDLRGLPREALLEYMAGYEVIYTDDHRTAIEAKALGCKVIPVNGADPDRWNVFDNRDVARLLQEILIDIDGRVIIDHTDEQYIKKRESIGVNKYNGAFYYSQEIVRNIIPNVDTDRNWITIKAYEKGADHSICFVHNNLTFESTYDYMRKFKDVVYVVGLPDMIERVSKWGKVIYLPLSVDVDYVKGFKRPAKTRDTAFVGRKAVRRDWEFPEGTDFLEGLPRHELLAEMGKYKRVYAIGRTAIEAKILGCEVLPFHPRLMDPDLWQIRDNHEMAKMLQEELDKIDDHKADES